MELRFLGRGAAFNAEQNNTAACIREGGHLLLLDCGETVFRELKVRGLLEGVREVTVAVSHLHSDHCGSLGTLGHYCRYALGAKLRLVVPERGDFEERLRMLLQLFGIDVGPDGVCFIPAGPLGFAAFERLDLVPTRHAEGMTCYSFVMETAGGGVFYSADTCTEAPFLDFVRTHPAFERAYMDATSAEGPGIHLPLSRLAAVTPPALRSRVYLMHVNDAACLERGRQLGFGCAEV